MSDQYETHARGNESLRDAMDGILEEPVKSPERSTEKKEEDDPNVRSN